MMYIVLLKKLAYIVALYEQVLRTVNIDACQQACSSGPPPCKDAEHFRGQNKLFC